MKKPVKICIAAAFVAVAASLAACNNSVNESAFDNPLPWHDDIAVARNGSYEKLDYTVDIFDTTQSIDADKRVTIATGALCFELSESLNEYTTLRMSFSVTYNDSAPEQDRGLTDRIESTVRFSSGGLAAQYMEKTVVLADRANTQNLSYTVTADYNGNQTATLVTKNQAEPKTLPLSKNTCRDNEMMFYLARAQAMAPGASTVFKMINVYQSFNAGKTTEYVMYAQASADKVTIDIGNFVQDFGVAAVTNEQTGEVSYPISCYNVNIGRNRNTDNKVGPAHNVLYAENPFVSGEKSHAKIPVKFSYNEFKNNRSYRCTEYTLNACTFDKL